MKKFTTNIRYYTREGKNVGVNKHSVDSANKAITLANAILNMDRLFTEDDDDVAPLMPTNISVRGAKGRFIKWKK